MRHANGYSAITSTAPQGSEKCFSHLVPGRSSTANSTVCQSTKLDLVKLCSQVLPLHSCYVCSFIACEISPTSLISSSNFWVIEQAESEIFALVDASVINKSCLMLREKEENRFPLPKLYQCRISLLRNESQGALHYTDWIQALSSSSRPVRV